jgi:hypothetical protein
MNARWTHRSFCCTSIKLHRYFVYSKIIDREGNGYMNLRYKDEIERKEKYLHSLFNIKAHFLNLQMASNNIYEECWEILTNRKLEYLSSVVSQNQCWLMCSHRAECGIIDV